MIRNKFPYLTSLFWTLNVSDRKCRRQITRPSKHVHRLVDVTFLLYACETYGIKRSFTPLYHFYIFFTLPALVARFFFSSKSLSFRNYHHRKQRWHNTTSFAFPSHCCTSDFRTKNHRHEPSTSAVLARILSRFFSTPSRSRTYRSRMGNR